MSTFTRENINNPKFTKSLLKQSLLFSVGVSTLALSSAAVAQDSSDEVVVTGTRQVIQDAIVLKRQATTIVDCLSADEIGDLPALSIAEALEQITSVGSQREGSGATEVSIRGLGPFLGSTVINGREATNGSGDRSVNFSQFPSELFNKLEVYKTQEASFIEGGVAGQIALNTLKPLEYGKRRIQLQAKGSLQPQNFEIADSARERDFGYRLTGSYVDQWESDKIGEFGISIGGQVQRRPNAEQEARSSSTFDACRVSQLDGASCDDGEGDVLTLDPTASLEEQQAQVDAFFDSNQRQSAQTINPLTGQPIGLGEPIVLTTSSRSFRQNVTDDERDSIFGAAQWRPNERLEFNADVQYADRTFTEFRSDTVFDTNDIEVNPDNILPGFDLQTTESGALRIASTSGDIQLISQSSVRSEEYIGFGGNASYDVTDRLNVSVDGSYSDTSRREEQFQARIATSARDVGIEVLGDAGQAQRFTTNDVDVFDLSEFTNDNIEVREDLNQFRNHEIWAVKGDAEYSVDNSWIKAFRAGARYSEQSYDQLPRVRFESEFDDGTDFIDGAFGDDITAVIELDVGTGDERDLANALGLGELVGFGVLGSGNDLNNDDFEGVTGVIPGSTATFVIDSNGDIDVTATAAEFTALGFGLDGDTDTPNEAQVSGINAALGCLVPSESNFLDGEVNGALITNTDDDGNVIGTTNILPQFAGNCLIETLLGRGVIAPSADDATNAELVQSVDVQEDTIALYGQIDYDTQYNGIPIRGNFGLRYVDTTVTSNSFRTNLVTILNDEGGVEGLEEDPDNGIIADSTEFSYSEFLPSFSIVADIGEDILLRGGVFRALSRPDPSDLGNGRVFATTTVDDDTDGDLTLSDFIGTVTANGNPALEPFTSWNFDAAVEWYPNADTILGVGAYFKTFSGGFQNTLVTESFNIDGSDVDVVVPVLTTIDDSNDIFGIEINAAHAFDYLPGLLSGTGFKLSYNYADSNFDFEDGRLGESVTFDENGNIIAERGGFIPPANLVGLSTHTANGQVYWGIGDATLTAIGKYRSSFFQQFIGTPLNLRFIDQAFVMDARLSYKLNKNIKLSLEGTNILNTAREQFNPTLDSFAEINVFGPRVFAGITAKF